MLNPNKMANQMLDKLSSGAIGDLKNVLESMHTHLELQLECQRKILTQLEIMNKQKITVWIDEKQDTNNN